MIQKHSSVNCSPGISTPRSIPVLLEHYTLMGLSANGLVDYLEFVSWKSQSFRIYYYHILTWQDDRVCFCVLLIDSHPWFERNNTDALYRIKRTKNSKNQAKDAIRNPASKPAEDTINSLPNNNRRHGLERPIRPQSLMSTKKTSGNEDNSASVFGQAFQTIQSLSRVLPERSQVTSQIDGDRDRVALKLPSPKPIPPSLPIPSRSSNVPTSSRRRIDHQPEDKAITRRNPPNIWSILDDQILPIPLVSRTIAGKQNEAKQSSEHTFDEISIRSLEPRSIQAMKQHPDVLNQRGSRICSLDFSWLRSKY